MAAGRSAREGMRAEARRDRVTGFGGSCRCRRRDPGATRTSTITEIRLAQNRNKVKRKKPRARTLASGETGRATAPGTAGRGRADKPGTAAQLKMIDFICPESRTGPGSSACPAASSIGVNPKAWRATVSIRAHWSRGDHRLRGPAILERSGCRQEKTPGKGSGAGSCLPASGVRWPTPLFERYQ